MPNIDGTTRAQSNFLRHLRDNPTCRHAFLTHPDVDEATVFHPPKEAPVVQEASPMAG